MRLIWAFLTAAISWTVLDRLFTISNNEGTRPPRPRRLRGRRAHPKFSPGGARATCLGFEPQSAAARYGRAARRPPDEPHHPQLRAHRSRRIAARPRGACDA